MERNTFGDEAMITAIAISKPQPSKEGIVAGEFRFKLEPGFGPMTLRLKSNIAGDVELNSDANLYGVIRSLLEAIVENGEESYPHDKLTFEVEFERGARADSAF